MSVWQRTAEARTRRAAASLSTVSLPKAQNKQDRHEKCCEIRPHYGFLAAVSACVPALFVREKRMQIRSPILI